jgi:hypothetical protein
VYQFLKMLTASSNSVKKKKERPKEIIAGWIKLSLHLEFFLKLFANT